MRARMLPWRDADAIELQRLGRIRTSLKRRRASGCVTADAAAVTMTTIRAQEGHAKENEVRRLEASGSCAAGLVREMKEENAHC